MIPFIKAIYGGHFGSPWDCVRLKVSGDRAILAFPECKGQVAGGGRVSLGGCRRGSDCGR